MTGSGGLIRVAVTDQADVSAVRREAARLADELGFDPAEREEIVLVASELASNLIKHAGGGVLTMSPAAGSAGSTLQIETLDDGPGIRDLDEAIADGYSTSESLGVGLGTVNRLMDTFEIDRRYDSQGRVRGTAVRCQRRSGSRRSGTPDCPFDIGAASRPRPGMELNGDAFVARTWDTNLLVAVIDGLGHGQAAHRAAMKAVDYVEGHFRQPLAEIFRGTGLTCRATRGIVMGLARFDWMAGTIQLSVIGNITVRTLNTSEPVQVITRRGVIGGRAPLPVMRESVWDRDAILLMHSDGIATHWNREEMRSLPDGSSSEIAREMLLRHAREHDDATVVVVRRKRS